MAPQPFYRSEPSERSLLTFHLEGAEIRTATSDDGNIWFCAKDVCSSLGLTWSGQTLQRMPKNWTCMVDYHTQGDQVREITFINEPGVYRLAFRSNKPEAERFCNWVCGEVLPAIRKHGYFGEMPPQVEVQLNNAALKVVERLIETDDAWEREFLIRRAERLFMLLGQPMPDLKLLGQSPGQQKLPGV